jgi:hypothetical protein
MENSVENKAAESQGDVRVRSNVCLSNNDWRLVPGDAIRSYGIQLDELTVEQQEERMRYEPCCLCHRTVYEIFEFGCDHHTCQRQVVRGRRIPSTDQATRLREERMRREDAL